MPYTRKLLAAVGRHHRQPAQPGLDQRPYRGNDASAGGNWELSSARANAARALLQAAGWPRDRIYEVAGKAGSEPLLPEDPSASRQPPALHPADAGSAARAPGTPALKTEIFGGEINAALNTGSRHNCESEMG